MFVRGLEFWATDLCFDLCKCISVDMFHLGSVRFSLAWDFQRDLSSRVNSGESNHKSRGCLGSFTKPSMIISIDEASKGLRDQGQAMNKDDRSEYFWTSSAYEIDQGALQSQRSTSSIGVSNSLFDPQSSADIQIDSTEFVNHGLILWKQIRKQWVGNRRPERQKPAGEPRISWNATYESLLGTSKPYPRPIPLEEMVEFVVDVWELEGLYD